MFVEHAQLMRGDLRVHLKTAELVSPVAVERRNFVVEERRPIPAEERFVMERLTRALAEERAAPLGRE